MAKQPPMPKKHYKLIASTIGSLVIHQSNKAYIANEFADKLEQTNPFFNRDTFLKACGVMDGANDSSSSD